MSHVSSVELVVLILECLVLDLGVLNRMHLRGLLHLEVLLGVRNSFLRVVSLMGLKVELL